MNCPNCLRVVLGLLGHLKALPIVGLSVFVLLSYIPIYNYINNTTNKYYYNQKYKDTRTILCNLWYIKDSTVLIKKDSLKTRADKTGEKIYTNNPLMLLVRGVSCVYTLLPHVLLSKGLQVFVAKYETNGLNNGGI